MIRTFLEHYGRYHRLHKGYLEGLRGLFESAPTSHYDGKFDVKLTFQKNRMRLFPVQKWTSTHDDNNDDQRMMKYITSDLDLDLN